MAFVCVLESEVEHAEMFRRGNAYLVLIPVGYDDEEDRSYSLFVTLDVRPGGNWEFSFCLVEHDGESDSEYSYWSGRDVARFIGRGDRARILARLLGATEQLVDAVQPSEVHMCTMDVQPPDQAMRKHALIAQVFESCGYEVHTAEPYQGQRIWFMERKA